MITQSCVDQSLGPNPFHSHLFTADKDKTLTITRGALIQVQGERG